MFNVVVIFMCPSTCCTNFIGAPTIPCTILNLTHSYRGVILYCVFSKANDSFDHAYHLT